MLTVDINSVHRHEFMPLFSPAFTLPAPRVRNLKIIPPQILEAMRPGWLTGQHVARPIQVTKLFDVFVTEEGLVFTQDRKLIAQSITQHSPQECQRAYERLTAQGAHQSIEQPSLLLRKRGDHNYGHWLVEVLPKLWAAEHRVAVTTLVVPALASAMQSVIRDSIALSAARHYAYLPVSTQDICFFKELVLVHGLTEHGVYMSPQVFDRTDAMRMSLPESQPMKIYVERTQSARRVVNAADCQKILQQKGFISVDPAHLTFLEQVRLFKNAVCVVGVMGAGMANMAFCPSGCKTVVLAPATMPDTFFSFIAGLRRLNYTEIRGPMTPETMSWDEPFSIDPAQLEASLAV
ncbi:MAG: glycosyltransferase family 61 protein [Acetobacter cibinongensis]